MDYSKIEEAAELKKWEERGYLTGITDSYVRVVTSLMLENQELFDKNYDNSLPNALEIIKQVVPNLLAHKIVSVQPLFGPAGIVYHTRLKPDIQDGYLGIMFELYNEDVVAKTRKLKVRLDKECDLKEENPSCFRSTEEVAADILHELNTEVLNDLWNNVGTVVHVAGDKCVEGEKVNFDHLYNATHNLNNCIHRKSLLNHKKWIVLGENTFNKFSKYFKYLGSHPYDVHIVKGWDKDGFLMGMKGEKSYEAGYVYAPYIMLSKTPTINDPEFVPLPGVLTRYAKKLWRGCSKQYGKVTLNSNATFKDLTNAINTTCSSGFIPPCG